VLNVIFVGIQGWLGSIVVSTNLMPWLITVHMMLALVIVGVSIYTYFKVRSFRDKDLLINRSSHTIKWLSVLSLVLVFFLVLFGTEVREHVDQLGSRALPAPRDQWIDLIGNVLDYHRIVAYISGVIVLILYYLIRLRFAKDTHQAFYSHVVLILVILQFITGYVMYHFALPPFAQTSHLVLASLMFGAQYYLMLLLGRASR
jgi:cytochrome c oxidase assembly protein subunit 15